MAFEKGHCPTFSWEGVEFWCRECGGSIFPKGKDVMDRMTMPRPPRETLDGGYTMRATCPHCGSLLSLQDTL